MNNKRWAIGNDGHILLRDGHLVGLVLDLDIARELVDIGNELSVNDRETIVESLRREANRVFNYQSMDFPSNILDIVAANLAQGKINDLTVPPSWMSSYKRSTFAPEYSVTEEIDLESYPGGWENADTTPDHHDDEKAAKYIVEAKYLQRDELAEEARVGRTLTEKEKSDLKIK